MFRWFLRVFMQGLVAMIPIALTIAIIVWLGVMAEKMLTFTFKGAIPSWDFIAQLLREVGAFVLLVFLCGLLMKLWLVRHLFDWVEARIIQIPLVKTVYGSIKDVMALLGGKGGSKGEMVVMVTTPNGWRQLGIVTRRDFSSLPRELTNGEDDVLAVYLPFSYQLGGFTYFIKRGDCEPVPGMSVEDAMRLSVMAWLGKEGGDGKAVSQASLPGVSAGQLPERE